MTPTETTHKKISGISRRRWGREAARVGVREVKVGAESGFCVQCWRDTLARRKREVKVRAPSGFVFGGGGMTPIEPRAGNVYVFRGGVGREELRESGRREVKVRVQSGSSRAQEIFMFFEEAFGQRSCECWG
jgi:hypothetical protein